MRDVPTVHRCKLGHIRFLHCLNYKQFLGNFRIQAERCPMSGAGSIGTRLVLALMLSTGAAEGGNNTSSETEGVNDKLDVAVQKARVHHINIIDARIAVSEKGEQEEGQKEGAWRFNVNPGNSHGHSDSQFNYQDHNGINVIFVHGYNTSATDAIANGNRLWELLTTAREPIFPLIPVEYFVFVWKGDFGKLQFSKAQHAAAISSKALADFLGYLAQKTPSAKTVIMAHSLGTQVALDAVKDLYERGQCGTQQDRLQFDSLVLIQGAVPAISLYTWTVDLTVETINLLPGVDPTKRYQEYKEHTTVSGRYVSSLKCTRQLLYTVSKEDKVLGKWMFQFDEFWLPYNSPRTASRPDLPYFSGARLEVVAIGSPFDESVREETVGSLLEPLNPMEKQRSRKDQLGHAGGKDYVRQQVRSRYSGWKVVHPNFKAITVSDYVQDHKSIQDQNWWHSPIFDDTGWYLVEEIWKDVIQALQPVASR